MTLVGKSGNRPLIWFALKSIARPSFTNFVKICGNRPYIWLQERFKYDNVGGRSVNHSAGMVSEI